jgi:hypothetical protein
LPRAGRARGVVCGGYVVVSGECADTVARHRYRVSEEWSGGEIAWWCCRMWRVEGGRWHSDGGILEVVRRRWGWVKGFNRLWLTGPR